MKAFNCLSFPKSNQSITAEQQLCYGRVLKTCELMARVFKINLSFYYCSGIPVHELNLFDDFGGDDCVCVCVGKVVAAVFVTQCGVCE